MKPRHFILPFLIILIFSACDTRNGNNVPAGSTREIEREISAMLREMTLEEKVGQMVQVTLDVIAEGEDSLSSYEPVVMDPEMMRLAFEQYQVGSVLNTANNRARDVHEWNRTITQLQEAAIAGSRLNIPIIYGLDMIHGASYVDGATFFPQQIGMAATWNPSLVERAGEITAYETRATGVAWTFSPVLDLGVDPRWPRQWETFGEDPLLASVMGHHLIKGLEGRDNDLSDKYRIASCPKHFLGYSQTLSGKDRTPAWIPENMLREYHLPPFAAGVRAGAMTVMLSSGEVNGLPVHASKHLITEVLKGELGFNGFVLTDWNDIEYLHRRHRIAPTLKEAVKISINAGVDMSMVPYHFEFADHLIELVREGEVSMDRIDDAVRRILRVKHLMGLFDTPYTLASDYPDFASEHFAGEAFRTASESLTLLKNEGHLLPLPKNARILVGGPAANSMRPLNGGWSYSWQGNLVDEFATGYNTVFEAFRQQASDPALVSLYEGVRYEAEGHFSEEIVDDLQLFPQLAGQADYIVLAIGENSYCEFPGNLTDLYLSDNQQELVRIAAATGKPVILVLVQGRPRLISPVEPLADAVLNAYLPGNYGGDAIAAVLYGDVNPSGKLPFTYPRYPNSLEPYYIKHTEQLERGGPPPELRFFPQYHFGDGLSYSEFEFSELWIEQEEYKPGGTIRGSVQVRNLSGIPGMEVVQVFVSDHYASLTPSVKRLRAFEKVMLQPGQTRKVEFEIPVNELAFVHLDNRWVVEEGGFTITAGGLAKDFRVNRSKVLDKQ
jgi:beta-glucosidase